MAAAVSLGLLLLVGHAGGADVLARKQNDCIMTLMNEYCGSEKGSKEPFCSSSEYSACKRLANQCVLFDATSCAWNRAAAAAAAATAVDDAGDMAEKEEEVDPCCECQIHGCPFVNTGICEYAFDHCAVEIMGGHLKKTKDISSGSYRTPDVPVSRDIPLRFGKLRIIDGAVNQTLWKRWTEFLEWSKTNGKSGQGWSLDTQVDFQTGKTAVENAVLHHDDPLDNDLQTELFESIMDHAAFLAKGEIRFLRGYTNYYVQTDQGYIHQDEANVGGISAVWYCHPDWHLNWGGELVIYDVQDEAMFYHADRYLHEDNIVGAEDRQRFYDHVLSSPMHAITPAANRLVIFDSHVLHAARPPQSAEALRLSTAVKLYDSSYMPDE